MCYVWVYYKLHIIKVMQSQLFIHATHSEVSILLRNKLFFIVHKWDLFQNFDFHHKKISTPPPWKNP